MKRTIKVQPVLTYTASDGRKYHEKAILSVVFDGGDVLPICMVDVEPLFYDNSQDHGGDLYRSIIDGNVVLVEMDITFKAELK